MTPPLAGRPRRALVATIATLALLTGVGACSPASDNDFDGAWKLVELDGKPVGPSASEQTPSLELAADEHKVTGFTGCNRLTGTYQRDGAKLKFSPLATTRRFCAETATLEQGFLAALTATEAYRISDTHLELIGAGKVIAKLARSGPIA